MVSEQKNAIIIGAEISFERGFMVSVGLTLDYGGEVQGFLHNYCAYHVKKPYKGFAGHFIARVMQIAEVEIWSQVVGKSVRAKADNDQVYGIGHIIKDDWFFPELDIAKSNELEVHGE